MNSEVSVPEPIAATPPIRQYGNSKLANLRRSFVTAVVSSVFEDDEATDLGLSARDIHKVLLEVQRRVAAECPGFKSIELREQVRRTTVVGVTTFITAVRPSAEYNGSVMQHIAVRSQPCHAEFRQMLSEVLSDAGLNDVSDSISLENLPVINRVRYKPVKQKATVKSTPTTMIKAEIPPIRSTTQLSSLGVGDEADTPQSTTDRSVPVRKKIVFDDEEAKRPRLGDDDLQQVSNNVSDAVVDRIKVLINDVVSETRVRDPPTEPETCKTTFLSLHQRKMLFGCLVCGTPEWFFNPDGTTFRRCCACKGFLHEQCVRTKGKKDYCPACYITGSSNKCQACKKGLRSKNTKKAEEQASTLLCCRGCHWWYCEHCSEEVQYTIDGKLYIVPLCSKCKVVYKRVEGMRPIV
ncbi:hypothetical protein J8273_5061 [Carpediemonas membranifera]|uniref:Uncharacterized protein n=2 Tax=Carpediemonas membranifera TaxID=201153 RepID=A0A8J6B755_9EUKA|nr:hypothetical protein J8273_6132 [Carpediemonas membranifera]KAG9392271.1 hypothetical protein J8273_5258 [Carpediemonas membranifera]KAG9392778.1 hypothetical protein J8273_5922 [Carpediemonas membranifera]KAG9393574.1 hypothetical protein J8273_5061 [Carpediemonas membranifera]|eukprot:KAG9391377.1 hypothetical protein J8273_6132 [Carpediemonas membranifera]